MEEVARGRLAEKNNNKVQLFGVFAIAVTIATLLGRADAATELTRPMVKRAAYYTSNYRSEFKRLPLYQFGLGKRMPSGLFYNNQQHQQQQQSSNEYKRGNQQRYMIGLGKRSRNGYSFGMGKRGSNDYNSNFLDYDYPLLPHQWYVNNDNTLQEQQQPKRAGSRYTLGLGKRDSESENNPELDDNDNMPEFMSDAVLSKPTRDKYLFGIGKRLPLDNNNSNPSNNLQFTTEQHDD